MTLTLTAWLATTDKLETAIQFISRLDDIVLREEAYRLQRASPPNAVRRRRSRNRSALPAKPPNARHCVEA